MAIPALLCFLFCFILSLVFNWRIIDLQCCVGFCCTMWTNHEYMYPPVCFLLNFLVFEEPPDCFHSGCTSFHSHPQSIHIILRGLFSRSSKPVYPFSWDGSAQEQIALSSFHRFSFSTPPFTIALFSCFKTKQQTSQPPVSYCGAKERDTCTHMPTNIFHLMSVCLEIDKECISFEKSLWDAGKQDIGQKCWRLSSFMAISWASSLYQPLYCRAGVQRETVLWDAH